MVTSVARTHDPRLADRDQRNRRLSGPNDLPVEHFVFRKITGFGSRIAALSRPLASAAEYGAITFRPGMCAYQGGIVLAVLRADAGGRTVGAAEHDGAAHLAAGHVERLGRRIDDLIDRLHGEVEGHELDDRRARPCAAPTPMPAKPCSVIGVSITRSRAEFIAACLG